MRSEGYCSRPVCVSVCQCVQASHPLLTQLQDQVDIPMDSVSCSLQIEFGVFSYNGLVSKIAIALPYSVVGHFYTRNGLIFRIPSVYYALDFTRAVNLYAHV